MLGSGNSDSACNLARRRRVNDAKASMISPSSTGGYTTILTADQPKFASNWPEENEPTAIMPNTRKSLKAWTLLRSCGRCVSSTSAEAPTKLKFQPIPSTISVAQKCNAVTPVNPMVAAAASSSRPTATTFGAPKRAISEPVEKLGPYIATICHWMPKLESLTESPHNFIASGAEVITRFIIG